MPLVGDIIERVRTLTVDQPPTLPPVTIGALSSVGSGSPFSGIQYFIVVTLRNQWGETSISNEQSITPSVGANIQIPVQIPLSYLGVITAIRVYIGITAGGESSYVEFSPASSVVTLTGFGVPGIPPQRNSAYNPDLDGSTFSAGYMFNLLTEALKQSSEMCDGIRDYSGVPTVAGNPMYVLSGQWKGITDVWYNGFWLTGGNKGYFFRRNTITAAVLVAASISIQDNRSIMEIYPQPDRTAGTSTLANSMGTADLSLQTNTGGFLLLPQGFIQIDSEIMPYYSVNGTTINLGLRGVGGSPAATHSAGATVQELNLFFAGRRIFLGGYQPGQSGSILPTPDGWSSILEDYMMYRIRQGEQEDQKAQAYYQTFEAKCKAYAKSIQSVMKRRQIGPAPYPEVYFPTPTGGLLTR